MAVPDVDPGLEGLTAGVVGLIVNVVLYVGCALLVRTPEHERERVDELFASVDRRAPATPVTPSPVLEPTA